MNIRSETGNDRVGICCKPIGDVADHIAASLEHIIAPRVQQNGDAAWAIKILQGRRRLAEDFRDRFPSAMQRRVLIQF